MQTRDKRGARKGEHPATQTDFGKKLLAWWEINPRKMPWRQTRDPYRVWVSEVLLQQTRVDQARPFYRKFIRRFPTVEALAAAPLDDVLKAWEGAGYYARARNLHKAANIVVQKHGGRLPQTYRELHQLPGFGPYTTAAVLSLAFGQDFAVLDGNVERVLCRVLAFKGEVSRPESRRKLQETAQTWLVRGRAGAFNSALMDLGSTVCTPRNPKCTQCPFKNDCKARMLGRQEAFPVAKKKGKVPHYEVAVGLVEREGKFLVLQRPYRALLGGFWEFPGGKREPGETLEQACRRELKEETGLLVDVGRRVAKVEHAYSHFTITLHAFECGKGGGTARVLDNHIGLKWCSLRELEMIAMPKANRKVISALKGRKTAPK